MGGEQLYKVIHKFAHIGAPAKAHLGNARLKQMPGIQGDQIAVGTGVIGHLRDDTNAQTQTHIGLDHIGIGGGKHHPWF